MIHTDIKTGGWIAHLPGFAQPYLYLARLDRPIGIWLLLLPGWWAIALAALSDGGFLSFNAHDIKLVFLFLFGAIVMRGAGCVINDLWDQKLDAQVERTSVRPLAAGTLSPVQALVFLALLLAVGLVILLATGSLVTILLGFLTVPLIVLYPLMKRITWWPQLFLGVIFNFGALMGWGAVTGVLGVPALLLYAAGIFWTLGYDTIYAHQDMEDDARIGIRSAALRLGAESRKWVTRFYILAFVLLIAAFAAAHAGWLSLLALAFPAIHAACMLRNWDEASPESSLKAFKANRDTGLLVLLAAVL